jgi:hypothetical protein
MMRAALILASVATLAAMELATPPRAEKAAHEPLVDQTSVGTITSYDTLTEADRLELHRYMQNDASIPPASFVLSTPPVNSASVISQKPQKTISRHSRVSNTRKVVVAPPKPKPRTKVSENASNTRRGRAVVVSRKPCRQNALDSLLKALSLSPGCES